MRAVFLAAALFLLGASLVQAALSSAEHNALVDLYNSTSGASWTNKTNWMVAADECTWYGVTCDAGHATVQGLQISGNNMTGTLPASLGSLTSLQSLDLSTNQLSGNIPPQLGNLISLQGLWLFTNQLSGSIPPQLANLTSLYQLLLSSNKLSGGIPPQLGGLTSLQTLALEFNQLSGSIPPQLGSLTNLVVLTLAYNQLSGSIPPELGNLPSLINLELNSNQLGGSIPPELRNLTSLQALLLFGNQLSGSIPPELGNLTSLQYSDIRWNALYSTDPALTLFLNTKQNGSGGDWQSTQSIAPANLSTSAAAASAITVNWTPIVYTDNSGFYRVWYSTTSGGPYTPFVTTTSSKSSSFITVTGLATNTRYFFVVSTTTQPHPDNSNTVTSGFSAEVSGLTAAVSPPTATFSAAPSIIDADQSSMLTWSTTNATSVSIDNGIGAQPVNGSVAVHPTLTTTYTFTATGLGGTLIRQATVTVTAGPSIVFAAIPDTVVAGQSSSLTWSTTGGTSVSIDNGVGGQPVNGSVLVTPTVTTFYTLTAIGPGGTSTAQAVVSVALTPVLTLIAQPASISVGGSSLIVWSTLNANDVVIDHGIGLVSSSGSRKVFPTTTTTYTVTANGPGGTAAKSVTVVVVIARHRAARPF